MKLKEAKIQKDDDLSIDLADDAWGIDIGQGLIENQVEDKKVDNQIEEEKPSKEAEKQPVEPSLTQPLEQTVQPSDDLNSNQLLTNDLQD